MYDAIPIVMKRVITSAAMMQDNTIFFFRGDLCWLLLFDEYDTSCTATPQLPQNSAPRQAPPHSFRNSFFVAVYFWASTGYASDALIGRPQLSQNIALLDTSLPQFEYLIYLYTS